MKKLSSFLILFYFLLVILFNANAAEYYVATNGNDGNSGTFEAPFQTMQKAVDVMKAGDTCYIRGGRYYETVVKKNFYGKAEKPLVFRAWQDEQVILDGSETISTKWTKFNDNIWKTQILKPIWQLFVNGKSMYSARWPNGNWDDGSVWDKSKSMAWPEKKRSSFGFHYNAQLMDLDFSLTDGGIIIVNSGSFKTYKAFIEKHEAGTDHFQYDTSKVKSHFSYKKRIQKHGYFLESCPGLIDTENEWYFDPQTMELYLWPPGGRDPNDMEIRGKTQSYALDISRSRYIHFFGLNFFATTFRFVKKFSPKK